MNRRRFLQVCGLAGLAVMAPLSLREGRAASTKYKGPFWIFVNAGGGWDPTMLCDPKGGDPEDPKSVNHSYAPGQEGQAGSISFAPTTYSVDNILVSSSETFFGKHHDKLMVLNGVDTQTNNHDTGSRTTWSGQLSEGFPSLGALAAAAATAAAPVPMAYLSNGGYDATGGTVPLTRVSSVDAFARLAYPNLVDPGETDSEAYHTQATASRIAAAQAARIQAMKKKQTLPNATTAMGSLYLARSANDGLQVLGAELANAKIVSVDDFPDLAPIENRGAVDRMLDIMRQAQIALYAFKSGVAVSANLDMGGYDTHGNNDESQASLLMQLTRGLDYIYDQMAAMGLADQVYIVVGSDFGRTPYYNDQEGKDHWNITSMLLSGPGIPGDRVIGGTDDEYKPLTINPKSLAVDPGGIRLEPKHVHRALRKLAGITGTEVDKLYPLAGEDLPLFG
jgi:hypothetical protein